MLTLDRPPFGDAVVGRGLRVTLRVDHALDDDGFEPAAFASRYTYRLRAYDEAGALTSFVINDTVAPAASQVTATGWLDDYIPLGATAYGVLLWELVEVDSTITDTATTTDKAEVVLLRWRQPILAGAIT